jgi:hypothetical protein
MTTPQPGDLLFYTTSHQDWTDKLISWRTKSPWVHCEVVVEDGLAIGALHTGVERHPIVPGGTLVQTSTSCPRLPDALHYLESLIGKPYGWEDIANFVISLLLPHGPFLSSDRYFDCSALAVNFLVWAGYPLPFQMVSAPEAVSPGELAAALDVPVAPPAAA